MHALGGEHVGADQLVERLQQHGAAADLVGERRQAQLDALARIALGLPVERLMLAVLLEQDHRQQARPGKAARQDVERRRRLRDLLAVPAGELLPHVLHDLPLPRDHLQRLGHILAELGEPARAAAGACARAGHDHPLARQMRRERLARRLAAGEGANGRRCRGLLGRKLVLGGGGFELFELQLHLIEQPRLALAARAEHLPPQLLDGEPQMCDQHLRARGLRARPRQFGVAREQQLLQRLDIVGKGISAHWQRWNHKTTRL